MAETQTIPASTDALRSLIERSGLLPHELTAPVFESSSRSKNAAADLDAIVDTLVKQSLLTPFQARLLMKGGPPAIFSARSTSCSSSSAAGAWGRSTCAST